ncbi:unnamed protein product [Oreochromis niloticus]|nr:unnamed protein product [Mustela putorius furo]
MLDGLPKPSCYPNPCLETCWRRRHHVLTTLFSFSCLFCLMAIPTLTTPSMKSWDARLLMERSRAVMGPDISAHLAGTKKVQQVLARPGVLERFFPDQPQAVQQI